MPKVSSTILPLTNRERDVLECMASGFTVADTSEELCVSKWTVKHTRSQIFKKLEANTSAHAIYLAVLKGLIDPVTGEVFKKSNSLQKRLQKSMISEG